MMDVTTSERVDRLTGIFTAVLRRLEAPVHLSGKRLDPDEAAAPDGLLPVFLLEACSVWGAISDREISAPIRQDADALLGVRVVGAPRLPAAITLLCLAESAVSVMQRPEPAESPGHSPPGDSSPGDSPGAGDIISVDTLLARWSEKVEELRSAPGPGPQEKE